MEGVAGCSFGGAGGIVGEFGCPDAAGAVVESPIGYCREGIVVKFGFLID